ncbi:hypothetical protein SF148580_1482 [Shigella flexneri 1485-80]|nr:hypothetical protein SF148580_1482 [Shigella flexneri 1485-80]
MQISWSVMWCGFTLSADYIQGGFRPGSAYSGNNARIFPAI